MYGAYTAETDHRITLTRNPPLEVARNVAQRLPAGKMLYLDLSVKIEAAVAAAEALPEGSVIRLHAEHSREISNAVAGLVRPGCTIIADGRDASRDTDDAERESLAVFATGENSGAAGAGAAEKTDEKKLSGAAWVGDNDAIRRLLEANSQLDVDSIDVATTPLCLACKRGHLETVKLLLELGAKPNKPDLSGYTSLHYAAMYGRHELVQPLVDAGAKVDYANQLTLSDVLGLTAMMIAIGKSEADKSNRLKTVEMLIRAGATPNPNVKDRACQTPLRAAVNTGDLALVRTLIDADAEVNGKTKDGKTALHLAADRGDVAMVVYLIDTAEAEVNSLDDSNETPLYDAIFSVVGQLTPNQEKVIRILIARGADIKAENIFGETPLEAAGRKGIADLLQKPSASMQAETAVYAVTSSEEMKPEPDNNAGGAGYG